jgi:hypothetical protein
MLHDGVSRLLCGHGPRLPTWAWQGLLTMDAACVQGISEIDHLLVESEAATDADGFHTKLSQLCI